MTKRMKVAYGFKEKNAKPSAPSVESPSDELILLRKIAKKLGVSLE